MTAVTRWWWIRHAPVTHLPDVIYGNTDAEANVSDAEQFAALARVLPPRARWLTSSLQRTRQTADAIGSAGYRLPSLRSEPDLGEQDFGDWHGMTYTALRESRNGDYHRFWLAPADEVPPGGESFRQLCDRVEKTVVRSSQEHAGQDVVCVAHGGTIRAALRQALGMPHENALGFTIDNLSVTRINYFSAEEGAEDAWQVMSVNVPPLLGGQTPNP